MSSGPLRGLKTHMDFLWYAALANIDLVPVQEVEIHNCASSLPVTPKPNRLQRRAEAARKRRK